MTSCHKSSQRVTVTRDGEVVVTRRSILSMGSNVLFASLLGVSFGLFAQRSSNSFIMLLSTMYFSLCVEVEELLWSIRVVPCGTLGRVWPECSLVRCRVDGLSLLGVLVVRMMGGVSSVGVL